MNILNVKAVSERRDSNAPRANIEIANLKNKIMRYSLIDAKYRRSIMTFRKGFYKEHCQTRKVKYLET
jgi:hypothetical protein